MESVIQEIAKASPFAAMCILIILIVNNAHSKNLKHVKDMFDSSITTIKGAYNDGMILTREAMVAMGELKNNKRNKTYAETTK